MPPKNSHIEFKNNYKKLPLPFVAYADFECFTKPINNCEPYPNNSFSIEYQKHEPCGFCLYIKPMEGINIEIDPNPLIYAKKKENEDIAKMFVKKLEIITKKIYSNFYKFPKPMIFKEEDRKKHSISNICHICQRPIKEDEEKVRDHCHFTGKCRGAAHKCCYLNCRKPLLLPVIFHNLQGYDAHLFIKQLAKIDGNLTTIPATEERYISFSKKIKVDEYTSKKNKRITFIKYLKFVF